MKALVVDDVIENVYMLEALFRGNGYEVATARNGEEALERLRAGGADVVVSDILMPGMDGYMLCRAIRADEALKSIPFVFYTATYTDPKDFELGLSLGADRFLVKPMESDALLQSLREVITARFSSPGAGEGPSPEEMEFLRRHNEALFRKLDKKMAALEKANRELEWEARNRERAEADLRESERRFREALEFLPIPIGIAGKNGKVLFYNRDFMRRFGYKVEDTPTIEAWMALAYPDPVYRATVLSSWDADVSAAVGEGAMTPVREYRVTCKDGGERIVGISMFPMGDRFLSTFNDITDYRRTEDLLRQSQKMEALGAMAGGVAHDFNNILTVILGCASMLQVNLEKDTKNNLLVNEIIASVERASDLTRSLLAFSRKQVTKFAPVDLNKVVSELRKSLRRLIREDIDFRCRLHDGTVPVTLDRSQIEQVIVNLAVNARDAMPSGGILSISLSTVDVGGGEIGLPVGVHAGRYAVMSVSDTGVGMDRETQKRIFEPFFTTKEVGKGTGLGLSIVYGIIAQHCGYLDVYSEKGHGTTFKVYLPLNPEVRESPAEQPEADERRGTGTVLLVEDEESVRLIIGEILEDNGYRVLSAANGSEGLELFGAYADEIVLVVSDLVMPRMNGRQMCDAIRKVRGGLPVLFLSGYPGDLLPGNGDSATVYLQKPVMPSELLTAAHDLVEGTAKG